MLFPSQSLKNAKFCLVVPCGGCPGDALIVALVKDRATGLSKGGMASKLAAARMCTAAGENVEVEIENIGKLINKVVAETAYANIKAVGMPTWDEADQALGRRESSSNDSGVSPARGRKRTAPASTTASSSAAASAWRSRK